MVDITWKIHNIIDAEEYYEEKDGKDYPYIGNFHTHGLNEYNDQRELCIVLAIPDIRAKMILNTMGLRVADNETVFTEGIRTDILTNDMDVELISFDNDPTLYIILPDANGKLPSDEDCVEPYKYQYEYAKIISEDEGYV
jgi:hypothetical protein